MEVRPRYEYTYDQYGNRLTIRDNIYVDQTGGIYYDHGGTTAGDFSADFDTRVTTFTYDHRGRQLTRTLPEGMSELMAYNDTLIDPTLTASADSVGNGQLEYSESFEDKVTAYRYDNTTLGGGRLVEKRYHDSLADYLASTPPAETVSYTYDEFGRQLAATHSVRGATTNTYDAQGRLTQIASPEGTVNYAYDPATAEQIRTYTDKTDITHNYNDLGQLTSVVVTQRDIYDSSTHVDTLSGGNETTAYYYDLEGRLDYEELASGTTRDLIYDELGRLDKVVHFDDVNTNGQQDTGESVIASFDYAYDVHHKQVELFEEFDTDNNGTLDASHRYRWAYDDLGRLVEEVFDDAADGNSLDDYIDRFAFDLVGNRLKKEKNQGNSTSAVFSADETTDYSYDDNDRVVTEVFDAIDPVDDKNTIYEYGPNATTTYGGDHTTQTAKTVREGITVGVGTEVETQDMEYNSQGRLSKVTTTKDGGNSVVTDYEYSDSGFRVSQTVDGEKTIYVVDPNNQTGYAQTLEERDAAGNVIKTFTIGLDVATQATITAAYHLLYDAHGSTRVLMQGTTGTAVEFYAYDAYGKLLDLSGFASALQSALVSLLYSGEFRDASTGWDFNRARWSQDGRFNRLDPYAGDFLDPQSLHKMLYAHGDPVNGVDPSGEFLVGLLVSIGIGALLGGSISSFFGGSFLKGAALGGLGAGVGSVVFAGSAALYGTGTFATWLLATGSSGFAAGAAVGGTNAWWEGGDEIDIIFDALESGVLGAAVGIGFGYLFAPQAIARSGSVRNANFAQRGELTREEFSNKGKQIYTSLAGRTINTVDDLAEALRDGALSSRNVPVDYVTMNGTKVILNTRTSTALVRSGIPRSSWYGSNQTGLTAYPGYTFDDLAYGQLRRNDLFPIGTPNPPR